MAPPVGHAAHLHDLRHTFAVRTISAWYRSGRDVQELLPALATYMGHSHYSDTAYYLTLTAELLGFALDNFDKVWTKEVTYDED
jgi:integrase